MVDEILTAAGLQKRHNRYTSPPSGAFAVWNDDIDTDGPDGMPPVIYTHNVDVELYTPKPEPETEASLEAAMSERGLHWTKQDRYWIQSEKMYQTVYSFTYTEKRRI